MIRGHSLRVRKAPWFCGNEASPGGVMGTPALALSGRRMSREPTGRMQGGLPFERLHLEVSGRGVPKGLARRDPLSRPAQASARSCPLSPASETPLLPFIHPQMFTDAGQKLSQRGRYKKITRRTSHLLTTLSLSAQHNPGAQLLQNKTSTRCHQP